MCLTNSSASLVPRLSLGFSRASLPSVDHWALADARDGLLLLCSSCERHAENHIPERREIPKHFAVCDPLSGRSVLLPERGAGMYIGFYYLGAALVATGGGDDDEGDVLSFEVLLAARVDNGPRLCAFSSSSRQWTMLPCPATKNLYDVWSIYMWVDDGARAGECIYWVAHDWEDESEHLVVLDTRAKKFSTMNLPCGGKMCEKYRRHVKVMRSEDDAELRVMAMNEPDTALHFWRRDRSRSTRGRWVKEDVVVRFMSVGGVLDHLVMGGVRSGSFGGGWGFRIIDAAEGFVFFKHHETPWVFVLNLKEMTLQKLENRKQYSGYALPYRMALSPPLPNFNQHGNN